jgi:hypothetical protein
MITAILVFAAPAAIVALPAPLGTIAACCCVVGIYLREIQRENAAEAARKRVEDDEAQRAETQTTPPPRP